MKMKNSVKISSLFLENRGILVINFFVLCYICGVELEQAKTYNIGIWGYIIMILSNHYYILYCLLPIMFIILTKYLRKIRSVELVRYRNRYEQSRKMVADFICWLVSYFTIKVCVIVAIGVRTFGLSVFPEIVDVSGYDELIIIYNSYISTFHNGIIAVIAIVAYYILGFIFLLSFLGYVNNRYGYKRVLVFCLFIYLFAIIGFRTELKSAVPFVCFNNYILLHHGLFVNGTVKFLFLIVFSVATIILSLGIKKRRGPGETSDFVITREEKNITVSLIAFMVVTEMFSGYINQEFNLRDVMLKLMFGAKASGFFSWLTLTIIYLIPIFFVGISDQRIKKYGQCPTVIRFKNIKSFECNVLVRDLQYTFVYVMIIWGLGCATYFLGEPSLINIEFFLENYGVRYNLNIWNLYIIFFHTNLLSDFIIFKQVSKLTNEIPAMVVLLIGKYVFFLVPEVNVFNMNFGIINLFEYLNKETAIYGWQLVLFVVVVIYVLTMLIRRMRYGNNRNQ